jgi:hypothetical protein
VLLIQKKDESLEVDMWHDNKRTASAKEPAMTPRKTRCPLARKLSIWPPTSEKLMPNDELVELDSA